jgi:L-2-hydroxyglutarate oxidase LhgO
VLHNSESIRILSSSDSHSQGYDAPLGSLEQRMLRRSIQLHPALYRSFGLSYQHVRKCGSLVVAWDAEEAARLDAVMQENASAGDTDVVRLTAAETRALEPALGPGVHGAVLCPREAVVEPWLVPLGYSESARLHGAQIILGTEVVSVSRDTDQMWLLHTRPSSAAATGRSALGQLLASSPQATDQAVMAVTGARATVRARVVVNCAGLHGSTSLCCPVRHLSDFVVCGWCGYFFIFFRCR